MDITNIEKYKKMMNNIKKEIKNNFGFDINYYDECDTAFHFPEHFCAYFEDCNECKRWWNSVYRREE